MVNFYGQDIEPVAPINGGLHCQANHIMMMIIYFSLVLTFLQAIFLLTLCSYDGSPVYIILLYLHFVCFIKPFTQTVSKYLLTFFT